MEVALDALAVIVILLTYVVLPPLTLRRAARTRAKVEAALAIGADVGSIELTGASVRSWRGLLDDFELSATSDDLHVVAQLLGPER